MVEPTDPQERAQAIRVCRANAHLDADTGKAIEDPEVSRKQWEELSGSVPYKKWLWIWNYARDEWA